MKKLEGNSGLWAMIFLRTSKQLQFQSSIQASMPQFDCKTSFDLTQDCPRWWFEMWGMLQIPLQSDKILQQLTLDGQNTCGCFQKKHGTPKSSILIEFSIIFTTHFGVPLFLETLDVSHELTGVAIRSLVTTRSSF